MLHKENIYGTEGAEQPPEGKTQEKDAQELDARITSILKGIGTGKFKVLTSESEGKVIVYEPDAEEEIKNGGEIDPARVIWMTDIEDFKKIRKGKILEGFSKYPKKETNN